MTHTIALAQCTARDTASQNLALAESFLIEGQSFHPELYVFPEYFMVPYTLPCEAYLAAAQPLDGFFVVEMKKLAQQYGVWLIFGINEENPDTAITKTYNTTVILDDNGNIQGVYRKTHVFDAFTWKESDRTIPGGSLFSPVKTPIGTVGLGMCYDLRFPELARHAALSGAEILIYPSAWVSGDLKSRQWQTLITSRAIENTIFTIGCNHYKPGVYLGESLIIDPYGTAIAKGGCQEELILGHISMNRLQKSRLQIPSLNHRREDLYC